LAGNKADLEDRREVTRETAQKYADEENAIFYETSAKTGDGPSLSRLAFAA
jgi:Ras-related protein Rab-5C